MIIVTMQKQLVSIVLSFVLGVLCATSYLHFYHLKANPGHLAHKTKPVNHNKSRARMSFVKIVKTRPASEMDNVMAPLQASVTQLDFIYLPDAHHIDFHLSIFRPPIHS